MTADSTIKVCLQNNRCLAIYPQLVIHSAASGPIKLALKSEHSSQGRVKLLSASVKRCSA